MIRAAVEDETVCLPEPCEVLLRVVDDVIGSDRPHHLDVARIAYSRHVCPERFRDLHRKGPDAASRAGYQHILSGLQVPVIPESLERSRASHPYGRSLLKCDVFRL